MRTLRANLVFILLLTIVFSAEAQNKRAAREMIWELLANNNPDAYYFMTKLYELPVDYAFGNMQVSLSEETDFMEYVDHYKLPEILDDMGTAVHEACHGYESRKPYRLIEERGIPFDFEESYSVYFVSRDEEYLVRQTATFPSREMARDIHEKYRSLRFDTYINTSRKYLGTQQKGIYGLMDEFTAYYNGFKSIVLNFPEYQKYAESNVFNYLHYIEHSASQKIAYYEFTFYILQYLSYANINYPELYREILNNEPFKEAFSAVSKAYRDIIIRYENNIQAIKHDVESRGESFKYDGESVWIGNNGIGTFSEDEKALKDAIGSLRFRKIAEKLNVERSAHSTLNAKRSTF